MTIREKLDLLSKSEDRNAAIIAAYEEGVTTGIGAAAVVLDMSTEKSVLLAMLAGAYAKGAYDAPSNEDLEDKSDE